MDTFLAVLYFVAVGGPLVAYRHEHFKAKKKYFRGLWNKSKIVSKSFLNAPFQSPAVKEAAHIPTVSFLSVAPLNEV